MSPPRKSTAGENPCSGCLDLRLNLYRRLCDVSGFSFDEVPSLKYVDIHYYISSFCRIEEMSKRGCEFCSILDRGMRNFWDLDAIAQRTLDSNDIAADSDEEVECSISSGNDNKYFCRPCIEIRPGRGLLVSVIHRRVNICGDKTISDDRTDFVSPIEHFAAVRAPLEFYSISGQNEAIPAFGRSVNIPTELTADRCGRLLNKWIQECSTWHQNCQPNADAGCPKRLIQVSGSQVRLIDAGPQFKAIYTTLSHRWGTKDIADKMFKTTKSNLKNLQKSICWDSLPRTFQDAITITRNLSCDYIWIDSLCIVQRTDSDDCNEDWKEQASHMSSIYANSYLNIAATASHDGNGGLMFPRFSLNEDVTSSGRTPVDSVDLSHDVAVRPDLEHVHSVFFEERVRNLKKGELSPLLIRAWVFQEQVLPGRTVHFTYAEMVWECRHHTVCECGGLDDWGRHHTNSKKSFNDSITGKTKSWAIFESWRRYVSAYTELEITNDQDWPFAIAGIASRLQPHVKSRYLAGIWEADIPTGLLWGSSYFSPSGPLKEDHWELSEDTSPTWSWLRCVRSIKSGGTSKAIFYLWSYDGADTLVPDSRFGFNLTDLRDRSDTEYSVMYFTNVRLQLRGAVCKGLASLRSELDPAGGRFLNILFPEKGNHLNVWADFPLPAKLLKSDFEVFSLLLGAYETYEDYKVVKWEVGLILSDFCSNGSFFIRIGNFRCKFEGLFEDAEIREIEVR